MMNFEPNHYIQSILILILTSKANDELVSCYYIIAMSIK